MIKKLYEINLLSNYKILFIIPIWLIIIKIQLRIFKNFMKGAQIMIALQNYDDRDLKKLSLEIIFPINITNNFE